MSKEIRLMINKVKNFENFLNEQINYDLLVEAISQTQPEGQVTAVNRSQFIAITREQALDKEGVAKEIFEKYGRIPPTRFADTGMAEVRLSDGTQALVDFDFYDNLVTITAEGGDHIGYMRIDRDYKVNTISPASGGKSQTIKVDKNYRRRGAAQIMMDYASEKTGSKWDFSTIERGESISPEAIALFDSYMNSRPEMVVNVNAGKNRIERARNELSDINP